MVELVWFRRNIRTRMKAGESLVDLMAPMTSTMSIDGRFIGGSCGCFVGGADGFDGGFDGGFEGFVGGFDGRVQKCFDGSFGGFQWLRWLRWWRRWIG